MSTGTILIIVSAIMTMSLINAFKQTQVYTGDLCDYILILADLFIALLSVLVIVRILCRL